MPVDGLESDVGDFVHVIRFAGDASSFTSRIRFLTKASKRLSRCAGVVVYWTFGLFENLEGPTRAFGPM